VNTVAFTPRSSSSLLHRHALYSDQVEYSALRATFRVMPIHIAVLLADISEQSGAAEVSFKTSGFAMTTTMMASTTPTVASIVHSAISDDCID